MDEKTQARFETRARVVKALAHPTRLFIVDALSNGEKCVCELTEMIGADTSTVSKHLSILKSAGIIRDSKRGLWVWYKLTCPCIATFFDCLESVVRTVAEDQMAAL